MVVRRHHGTASERQLVSFIDSDSALANSDCWFRPQYVSRRCLPLGNINHKGDSMEPKYTFSAEFRRADKPEDSVEDQYVMTKKIMTNFIYDTVFPDTIVYEKKLRSIEYGGQGCTVLIRATPILIEWMYDNLLKTLKQVA